MGDSAGGGLGVVVYAVAIVVFVLLVVLFLRGQGR
jgi:NADH:ubiquinone oxidoreductase subunit 6 (subunit J)